MAKGLDWRALAARLLPQRAAGAPGPAAEPDRVGALVGLIEGRPGWRLAAERLGGSFHPRVAGRISTVPEGDEGETCPDP